MERHRRGGSAAGAAFISILLITAGAIATVSLAFPHTQTGTTATQTETTTTVQAEELGAWSPAPGYPFPANDLSCVTDDGYIFCVGGYDGTTPTSGQGDINRTYYARLTPSGIGAWTSTTDYPVGIQDETCLADSGYIYCIGGYVSSPNGHDTNASYYAPLSQNGVGSWRETTSFPISRTPDCVISSGYIYCVDVLVQGNASSIWSLPPYQSVGYYAPIGADGVGNWSATNGYPQFYVQGCVSADGRIFCFGNPVNTCTDLCPPSPSYAYYAGLSSEGIGSWTRTTDLPTDGSAVYVLAGSYLYYLSVPAYFTGISSDGLLSWGTTTNYPESGSPAQCVSSSGYVYCTGGYNNDSYYSQVGGANPTALNLENPPPFQYVEFLGPAWSPAGDCSVSSPTTGFSGSPCSTYNIDDATIFDCGGLASGSGGCRLEVTSPSPTYDYNITLWYPDTYLPPGPSETNCAYETTGYNTPLYAWCISIGQGELIVSMDAGF